MAAAAAEIQLHEPKNMGACMVMVSKHSRLENNEFNCVWVLKMGLSDKRSVQSRRG